MIRKLTSMLMSVTIMITVLVGCTICGASAETAAKEEQAMTIPEMIKKTIENGGDPTAAVRVAPADEYYIFELSENIARTHVYYRTRTASNLQVICMSPRMQI